MTQKYQRFIYFLNKWQIQYCKILSDNFPCNICLLVSAYLLNRYLSTFTKHTCKGVGRRLISCYHVGPFFVPASFLEYPTFCWSTELQLLEDLAPLLDLHVQNLPWGCQEFQSLLPKQTGSPGAQSRDWAGSKHFFFSGFNTALTALPPLILYLSRYSL